MIRGLLPRKKRFRRCSKGVSTVIGTIFFVIIALTVATNVLLWSITQNAAYNQALKESIQMEADRSDEGVVAYDTVYSVSPDEIVVTTTMTAQGALSAQIIKVWVTWTDGIDTKHSSTPVNFNLTPGDTITPQPITVTVTGAVAGTGECNGWLITARGNRVPLEQKETIIVAELAQGIGSMAIDFYSFRYFTYDGSKLANYPDGTSSFTVPSGVDIAFGVDLTNLDPLEKKIVLNEFSEIWIYSTNVEKKLCWYIVDVASDGSVSPFTEISINYDDTKLLIFASKYAGTFSPQSIQAISGPCAVNLLLLGTIETIPPRDYGQNIPFVSIYVT